jgi:hypothetical protein
VIEISTGEEDLAHLEAIARSHTAPASRVERARVLLAEAVGVTHQTVKRCLDRAVRLGVIAALDYSPRPGKATEITADAKAWLVSLACRKAKDSDIRTNCGRRVCWRAMRASTPARYGVACVGGR